VFGAIKLYKKLEYKHLESFTSTEGYWSNTDCIEVAKDILEITKAKQMLEIGFNIGYSAATWLSSGIDILIVIDIGNHVDTLPAIRKTAHTFSDKKVYWWIGDSTSDQAKDLDIEHIDIAFIDGEHTYNAALSDSYLSIYYGADWLVYDDVIENHSNGIDRAVDKLRLDGKIEVVKHYFMSWTGQGEVILCRVIK
jgi:predicted O-methyltransferase YrrM